MEYGSPADHTPLPKKGIVARLLISAGSMLLAYIVLTVLVEILRDAFQYSGFQMLFEPVYVERQRALGSYMPTLAIIPLGSHIFLANAGACHHRAVDGMASTFGGDLGSAHLHWEWFNKNPGA